MADLGQPGTLFDTGVRGATAVLHGPPMFWSYSSLKELEACPRRYVLTRATYPEIWDGNGYPAVPSPALLFGDIVHDALDVLVKSLASAGCESLRSPGAVEVLKALGGISAVVRSATARRLRRVDGNPRVSPEARRRLAQELSDRAEEARAQVQEFLCRIFFPVGAATPLRPTEAPSNTGDGPAFHRRPVSAGTHPEITLAAEDLRLMGRIDLLTIGDGGACIVDYKTGSPDLGHLEQVSFYALLWSLDHTVNPGKIPVTELIVAYPSHDVRTAVADIADFSTLEQLVQARIQAADELAAEAPARTPNS